MPSDEDISSFIGATFRSVRALELLCFLRKDRRLAFTEIPVEERNWLYLLRLAAFSLILVSIWRKNRRA